MARAPLTKQEAADVAEAHQRHLLSEKRSGRPLNAKQSAIVRREMENSVISRRKKSKR